MSALFTPLKLGTIVIPNRIGMAALTRNRATGTIPTDVMREHYLQRAQGGAGLIVTDAVLVSRQGTEWQDAPGLWDQAQVEGWKKIVDAVHGAGSKIYAQLWHTGRVSHPEAPQQILAGVPVYAPSAISARGGKFRFIPGAPGYVTPTELPDPKTVVALFKEAAVNAKKAGFDGIEFHGANGYLIHQFLDSSSNHRTDEYGGSVENRARFVLELIAAVQDVFGPDVAIKLSPCGGYNDMGMPLSETIATFGYLLAQIDALPTPLSYVCLALYNPYLDIELEGTMRGTTHDVLQTYKGYFKSKPRRTKLFLNSGIQPDQAETFVGDGEGDVAGIFFGLAWIAHPDLAKRIQANKPIDNAVDLTKLYGAPGVDPNLGYNDYKAAV
ncbi:hypothetical protein HMN09_00837700 [Mycena chlorophos]|uniref:NADH:flavin oxidoreductase/NADH oxidase N-terminal domain-containing protein n=1 Tax=Mycena chlorophos TaxID=658473 RepID=A0A8H6ST08_MYCCL|nr:hypothetical protein HMN09_00837700 [Mycena chlorophos]